MSFVPLNSLEKLNLLSQFTAVLCTSGNLVLLFIQSYNQCSRQSFERVSWLNKLLCCTSLLLPSPFPLPLPTPPPPYTPPILHSFISLSFPSRGASGGRVEQDVEQARPTDTSEEEMQLKLALQLSKQQAEEEEKLK